MPALPRFRTEAVRGLLEGLRFAPLTTRRRQMDSAEALVAEIDPGLDYPLDFVVYRVSGFRPETTTSAAVVAGKVLLRDLAALVLHLSRNAAIPPDYRGRTALDQAEACRRFAVSAKTLQRYRACGLICHTVQETDGSQRLIYFADALDRFRGTHEARVARAASFSRMGPDVEARLIEEACDLRRRRDLSLHAAARHLAQQHHRSIEAVRGVLKRHDARSAVAIFDVRTALRPGAPALLHRAWRFGVPPARLARRFRRTPSAVHKLIQQERRNRLVRLDLRWVELPTFALADAESVILSAPATAADLIEDFPMVDVLPMLERADSHESDLAPLDSLLAAYNLLKRRAAGAIAALPGDPPASRLDPIETDLRWAALLARRLARLVFPAALRALEHHAHRRLAALPGDEVVALVALALEVIRRAIDAVDPGRGQRLDRLVAYGTDRALAARPPGGGVQRAAARHHLGAIRLAPAQRIMVPWQAWLDPRPDLRAHVNDLPLEERLAIAKRYGWEGGPPRTVAWLAGAAGTTSRRMARLLWRAEATLRGRARAQARAEQGA
jgi:RNA polymerase primary sigma factor